MSVKFWIPQERKRKSLKEYLFLTLKERKTHHMVYDPIYFCQLLKEFQMPPYTNLVVLNHTSFKNQEPIMLIQFCMLSLGKLDGLF